MSGLELLIPTIMGGLSSAGAAVGGALSTVAPIAGLLGTAATVAGTVQQGKAAKAAAETESLGLQAQAASERASAQRAAEEARRRGARVLSEQRATAAASGGGVTGTVLDLLGDTQKDISLAAGREMYLGEDRAVGLTQRAKAVRNKGKTDYAGSMFEAVGQGAKGLYSQFG